MDYEKKYNEALNDMRAIYPNLKGDTKLAVEHAFPELRESEDERIRKWLLECVENLPDVNFIEVSRQDVLFYLEKQKEQKYIGLSETDKFFLEGVANVLVDNEYKDAAKRLRDLSESLYLQPKGVWSEEDERLIKTTIAFLKDFADTGWENAVECIDWLKYLPMRCLKSSDNWKPSEEQIEALRKAVNKLADTEVADSVRLSIMYDNLKKLM